MPWYVGPAGDTASHPNLAVHDTLGLATQAELDAHAATAHGGTHPDLAAHDTLGLATQAELDAHAATAGHTHPNLAAHDALGLATQAELDAHAATAGHTHPDVTAHNALGLTRLVGTQDIEITDAIKGVILRSANGTRYRVTVSDAGALTTTAVV